MRLREHPLLVRKWGASSWPPTWTTTRQDRNDRPSGEVGTLEQVLMQKSYDKIVFIFILFQDNRYMGSLHLDDPAFARELFTIFKSRIGWSIKDLGDLDLSYTL
jgi:hypothetical protein